MLTVRVYDNYNLIALQGLDADDFEGCDFSSKVRAEIIRDMEITRQLYKVKEAGFSSSLNDFSVRHMPLIFPYLH